MKERVLEVKNNNTFVRAETLTVRALSQNIQVRRVGQGHVWQPGSARSKPSGKSIADKEDPGKARKSACSRLRRDEGN